MGYDMALLNAVTIDLEDWYQGIEQPFSSWGGFKERILIGTDKVLAILAETDTRATFFVLGWLAEKHPTLIRRIADLGHEVGTHGYDHEKLYDITPEALSRDLARAKAVTEDAIGAAVVGHRAPFFSMTSRSLWAVEVLQELGLRYDSSVYPGENWRYGIPNTPDSLYVLGDTDLIEFPASTFALFKGRKVGIGGAYFRILPLAVTQKAIAARMAAGQTTNFYLHPWEFDPKHPLVRFRWKAMATHYFNLGATEGRFRQLLKRLPFGPMGEVIEAAQAQSATLPRIDLERYAV